MYLYVCLYVRTYVCVCTHVHVRIEILSQTEKKTRMGGMKKDKEGEVAFWSVLTQDVD